MFKIAEEHGCQQCLWLFGEDHEITEVGAMNLFILLRDAAGNMELVTPPLTTGVILPGVTRRSIVELCSTWPGITVSERRITMGEVMTAHAEGRLVEMFGSGTAAVVSPVGGLHYQGRMVRIPTPEEGLASQIMTAMSDIYYGRVASRWAIDVEEWNVDRNQVYYLKIHFKIHIKHLQHQDFGGLQTTRNGKFIKSQCCLRNHND